MDADWIGQWTGEVFLSVNCSGGYDGIVVLPGHRNVADVLTI